MSKQSWSFSGNLVALTLVVFILTIHHALAQSGHFNEVRWKQLMIGFQYTEIEAPLKSVVNDSKLTILKIDPRKFEFSFLTASEHANHPWTADEWAMEFDQNIVFNAGMYKYNKTQSNKGYMRNYMHLNNPVKNTYYNALLAMHPKDPQKPPFEIIDTYQKEWETIASKYQSVCQGMRMISGEGEAMAFTKRPNQSCSMIVAATDTIENLYIVFTRSPYTHRDMIGFLKGLPFGLRTTVYLEGGPETSLYINTGDTVIAKFGSYVSNSCNNDDNDHFRKIPNVIGIRVKK